MYVNSQIYGYFGHWLSDVNTLEMKIFGTHLVFLLQQYFRLQTKNFNETPKC